MQVDQYKQMKESVNRVPNPRQPELNPVPQQPQVAAVIHPEAQQPQQLQKDEPARDVHQVHQESRVMWESQRSLYNQDKSHTGQKKKTVSPVAVFLGGPPCGGGACPV